ncbi:MAG: uracil-DNA glycosylase, partial [Clostridiales bacterium]|nr:uracil-DNA glycosylase [Clostridiales bacterium]
MTVIGNDWDERLRPEYDKPYFDALSRAVEAEYRTQRVYPPKADMYRALQAVPLSKLKVLIIGQDPYHGEGQANGMAFAVHKGIKLPPSLVNIFKEIADDLQKPAPPDGDLTRWAGQGVLLLNATLTVRAHQAGSHQNKGWETFTDAVIHRLAEARNNIVYLLWGAYAQKKGAFIDKRRNLVLTSAHPSPLSAYRGFFGNKHFSKAN